MLPLMIILVRNIRYDHIYISSLMKYCLSQWCYVVILMWQCALIAYWTLIPYGILTTLLSPCRLHVITLSLYMMYFSRFTKKMTANLYESNTEYLHNNNNENDRIFETAETNLKRKGNIFLHSDESYANLRITEL